MEFLFFLELGMVIGQLARVVRYKRGNFLNRQQYLGFPCGVHCQQYEDCITFADCSGYWVVRAYASSYPTNTCYHD